MTLSAPLLRTLRLTHLYFGVFIAPALLFFAVTGALQTFSLHETERGSTYQPPQWIITAAQIHKNQTAVTRPHRPNPPPAAAAPHTVPQIVPQIVPQTTPKPAPEPPPPSSPEPKRPNPLPLKIFFLLVSVGLVASTLTGISMAYAYGRDKRLITLLLLAGAILPIVLLFV